MNLFELGTYDYESSGGRLFSHPSWGKEKFDTDVRWLLREVGTGILETADEESWLGSEEWIDAVYKGLEELGYERVKVFSISYKEDQIFQAEYPAWKDVIGEDSWNQALHHNKKVQDSYHDQDD